MSCSLGLDNQNAIVKARPTLENAGMLMRIRNRAVAPWRPGNEIARRPGIIERALRDEEDRIALEPHGENRKNSRALVTRFHPITSGLVRSPSMTIRTATPGRNVKRLCAMSLRIVRRGIGTVNTTKNPATTNSRP